MKVIEVKEMSEKQWMLFHEMIRAVRGSPINKNEPGKPDWKVFRDNILRNIEKRKAESFNIYVLLKNDSLFLWFYILIDDDKARFDFEEKGALISHEEMKDVLKVVLKFLEENKKDEIYSIAYYKDIFYSFDGINAEIYNELLLSRLDKQNLNISLLKDIVETFRNEKDLKLVLYNELPEELYESYIKLVNEVSSDKDRFHPKKKTGEILTLKNY